VYVDSRVFFEGNLAILKPFDERPRRKEFRECQVYI